jgi:hypothetical protein
MQSFSAEVFITGVNPYVLLPEKALNALFKQAGKDKGPIPVAGTLNGHKFIQTLVKYRGHWRLYLNTPMRKTAGINVGDIAKVKIAYDPKERLIPVHPRLKQALAGNRKALAAFKALPPSRQKEIIRYISFLKTDQAIDKNVKRAIGFLLKTERFIGRDKP